MLNLKKFLLIMISIVLFTGGSYENKIYDKTIALEAENKILREEIKSLKFHFKWWW